MNHPIGQIIAQLLVTAGFGKWNADLTLTAADYLITYETMPDADPYPLAIMCGSAEGKREEKRSMRTGEPCIFPGCAVQVRAYDDAAAAVKAHGVAAFLDTVGLPFRRVTIGGTAYCIQNFARVYDPVFLMQEDRDDRRVWVFRGNVTIRVL